MDHAPGRIRVHEHAETGKPLAAYKLHQALGGFGILFTQPRYARRLFIRQRWNGPAGISGKVPPQRRRPVAGDPGKVGHKLSAIGLPYRKARS
jgi:hypothetical protein